MVTILRDAHAPTGNLALIDHFCKLTDLKMGHSEALATYMSRICTTIGLLCGGNIHLHSILVNLFAVKGLDRAYKDVKRDLALCIKHFTTLTLDKFEDKCDTFASASMHVQLEKAIPAAADAMVDGTSTTPPPPASGTSSKPRNPTSVYPPTKPRQGKLITAQMSKTKTKCPIYFREHLFAKCGYGHRGGIVRVSWQVR